MSKIVIDARESGTGGAARYVDKMMENLQSLGTKHDFVALTKPERAKELQEILPSFTIIPTPYKEFTFGEQLGFLKQLNSLHADLVHFPMVQQPILYRGKVVTTMQDLTTVRFRNPSKNPVVFWVKQQVYKFINIWVAHRSTTLITISKFVQQDVANYTKVSPNKLTVTYEAADSIPEKPEPVPSLKGKKFIMYLGRPLPHKNLNRLVDAFRIIQKDHPDMWLALASKKDVLYQRIEDRVIREGIPNVVFTDKIPESQLRWMFENCTVYAFPSLSEGFGLPALEAMRHGAPVASTNATCSPEIYGDGAYYFDPLDVADMAAKITEVIDNKKLRETLIAKGKKQAAKYTWQSTAKQTLAVYERVLGL